MSRGNAFVATADNPSAVYYNPAGIAMLYNGASLSPQSVALAPSSKGYVPVEDYSSEDSGLKSRLNAMTITLETEFRPKGGGRGFDTKREFQVVPRTYTTYHKAGSKFTFGFGSYAPYGLGMEWPEDSQFRRQSISGELMYISFNPVVAYRIADDLSIAAGATINYGRAKLKRGVFAAHDMFEFDGEGWSLGWNAGIMWRPAEQHSFGLNYRSKTDINFEGDTHVFTNPLTVQTPRGPVKVAGIERRENAEVGIKFPQHIVVGYSYRPTPRWNLEVNADWTDWDNLNELNLRQRSGDVGLNFNYESSWMYSTGASYQFENGLVGSVGYIYSQNSVPNESFNPGVPDSNRHVFSAGLAGKWRKFDWDIAYSWAHGPDREINQGTAVDGTYEFNSHTLGVGITSKF